MDLAAENAKYFDAQASAYDEKEWHKKLAEQLQTAIRANLDWIGITDASNNDGSSSSKKIRLMDYACGTGMVTRALSPHLASATGFDVSSRMLSVYSNTFASSPFEATTQQGNLLAEPADPQFEAEQFFGFDVVACSLAFHHFEDVQFAARRMMERLRPGGVLFIIDLLNHGHHHNHQHHHHHHEHKSPGEEKEVKSHLDADHLDQVSTEVRKAIKVLSFDEETIRNAFEGAGLVDFKFMPLEEKAHIEVGQLKAERTIFFAQARRPL